jgi:hypothetical protein
MSGAHADRDIRATNVGEERFESALRSVKRL